MQRSFRLKEDYGGSRLVVAQSYALNRFRQADGAQECLSFLVTPPSFPRFHFARLVQRHWSGSGSDGKETRTATPCTLTNPKLTMRIGSTLQVRRPGGLNEEGICPLPGNAFNQLPFWPLWCLRVCRCAESPSITLSKKSGPPTSKVLVSGSGFKPNVGVDIYFGTKDEALVVTNGQGEFANAKIYAPRSARPGQHWVTALERNNDKGAQVPFLVRTDWSQFHFDADGTRLNPYENVLDTNRVGDLDLKWSYHTGSAVWSSPAVANGVVYIGSLDDNLYALNAATGVVLWSYLTGNAVESAPAVANGVVYVGSSDHNVYALKADTGSLLWRFSTGSYVLSPPAVANGMVYIGSEDYGVYALDASTGDKRWSYATGSYVFPSPTVVKGVVYVGSSDDNVYALNASTGARLWSYTTGDSVWSSPTVANGVVYFGSFDNNVYALNASTGALLWSYNTGGAVWSSPAVVNGVVYVGSDALNASTGALLWSSRTGFVESSPAVANGVVYVGSYDEHSVYAVNASTGALLWSYPSIGNVYSSPVVANGVVYVGSLDNNIYAFGLPDGDQARQDSSSQRPTLNALRPDFSLKVSKR
jgi:outer membrane protein assembly factor BamB